MNFTKALVLVAFAVFALSPAMVSAAEDGKTVSYSLKKQGRVHFQDKKQDEPAAQDAADQGNPAEIEPAAGAEEAAQDQDTTPSLSERIRLPRKN